MQIPPEVAANLPALIAAGVVAVVVVAATVYFVRAPSTPNRPLHCPTGSTPKPLRVCEQISLDFPAYFPTLFRTQVYRKKTKTVELKNVDSINPGQAKKVPIGDGDDRTILVVKVR